jgi:hypothetical protein
MFAIYLSGYTAAGKITHKRRCCNLFSKWIFGNGCANPHNPR